MLRRAWYCEGRAGERDLGVTYDRVANVKAGRVMFELSGVAEPVAREALRRAIHKLPMKCRIVKREAGEG